MKRSALSWIMGAAALFALVASAPPSRAQQDDSLDKILQRGKVLIGMDMSADLGVELEIVQTSAANRIPYLVTGRVDMMLGAFSIFPDRAKSIWFTSPYGSVTSVILAEKDTPITSYDDLVGKRISVSRGTYTEQVLMAAVPEGAEIVRFDDDPQAMAAMAAGQVEAYGVGNVPGSALLKRFPGKYEIKVTIPPRNWYAIGVRKGDVDLLQWLNTFVFFHRENGDLKEIYERVIGDTLPPPPTL
jgi:polar amino acid transport system substrate-binding protein